MKLLAILFLVGCSTGSKLYKEDPWMCYAEPNRLARMWKLTCDWQSNFDRSAEEAIDEAGKNEWEDQ